MPRLSSNSLSASVAVASTSSAPSSSSSASTSSSITNHNSNSNSNSSFPKSFRGKETKTESSSSPSIVTKTTLEKFESPTTSSTNPPPLVTTSGTTLVDSEESQESQLSEKSSTQPETSTVNKHGTRIVSGRSFLKLRGSDRAYQEALEAAGKFNRTIGRDRKTRVPFFDNQTHVAQAANCMMWLQEYQRNTGTKSNPAHVYEYPSKKWNQNRRLLFTNDHNQHQMGSGGSAAGSSPLTSASVNDPSTGPSGETDNLHHNSNNNNQSSSGGGHFSGIHGHNTHSLNNIHHPNHLHYSSSAHSQHLLQHNDNSNSMDSNSQHHFKQEKNSNFNHHHHNFAKQTSHSNDDFPHTNNGNSHNNHHLNNNDDWSQHPDDSFDEKHNTTNNNNHQNNINHHTNGHNDHNSDGDPEFDETAVPNQTSKKRRTGSTRRGGGAGGYGRGGGRGGGANGIGGDRRTSSRKESVSSGVGNGDDVTKVDLEKPYGCHLCGSKYKTKPGLTYHVQKIHGPNSASPATANHNTNSNSSAPLLHNQRSSSIGPNGENSNSGPMHFESAGYDDMNSSSSLSLNAKKCSICFDDEAKSILQQQQPNLVLPKEKFISCFDCQRSFHPSCLQFNAKMVGNVKKYNWQCVECKRCNICGNSENDDKLLFCDDCDRGYHMYCLKPPLSEAPAGDWQCELCAKS